MKSFAGLSNQTSAITENLGKPVPNRTGHQTRASTMKTLLTICLSTVAFALVSLAQVPPPAQAPPATGGTGPAAQAPTNPAAAAQQPPATNLPPGQQVPPPGQPGAVGQPPAGQAPALGQPGAPGAVTSPAAVGATSPAAAAATTAAPAVSATPEEPAGFLGGNWLIDKFHKGGPIMWPILIVSIVALTVVLERCIGGVAAGFGAIRNGSRKFSPQLRMATLPKLRGFRAVPATPYCECFGTVSTINTAPLEAALQVAAGIEIKRAGRFLVVMDTLVTLAPLLGLLGTITGLIRSFSFLGNEELAVQAVTGGIAEALIATACGLGIAIFALIPFNFFTSRVSNLEFESTNGSHQFGSYAPGPRRRSTRSDREWHAVVSNAVFNLVI